MNKKEYCEANPFIGWKNEGFSVTTFVHGFEYGIEDYIITRIVWGSLDDPTSYTHHRNKIRYNTKGEPYYNSVFGRTYLKDFIRSSPYEKHACHMKTLGGTR